MKKVLLGIVMVLMMVGNGWGVTYDEARESGKSKFDKEDYVHALIDYQLALTLASTNFPAAVATYYIGRCKEGMKDYLGAITEYDKVLVLMPNDNDVDSFPADASHHKAGCYIELGDKLNAMKTLLLSLNKMKISPYKKYSFDGLMSIKHDDYTKVLEELVNVSSWIDYFYRAKIKEQLKDWIGAQSDLEEAWIKRPKDVEVMELIATEQEQVDLQVRRLKKAATP